MLHWASFQKRTGLQPLGAVFTVRETEFIASKGCGKYQLSTAAMTAKQKLRRKKKAVQTKQGFSAVQINYGKCLKSICSRKVHTVQSLLPLTSRRVKSWSSEWLGEKPPVTVLKTHLLGERYAAYCNCKKIKRKQISWELFRSLPPFADVNEIFPHTRAALITSAEWLLQAIAYRGKQTWRDGSSAVCRGRKGRCGQGGSLGWFVSQPHVLVICLQTHASASPRSQ